MYKYVLISRNYYDLYSIQGPLAYTQAKVLLIAFAISVPLLSMHIPAIIPDL